MYFYSAKNKVLVVIVMLLTFIGQASATNFISCQKSISSSIELANTQVQTMAHIDVTTHDVTAHSMADMECCEEDNCPMESCPMDSCVTAVLLSNNAQERLYTSSNKIVLPNLLPPSQLLKSLYYPPIV